jgi:hypothetical protein
MCSPLILLFLNNIPTNVSTYFAARRRRRRKRRRSLANKC